LDEVEDDGIGRTVDEVEELDGDAAAEEDDTEESVKDEEEKDEEDDELTVTSPDGVTERVPSIVAQ